MIKDYQIIEKIGKGTFGIVYKVKRLNDPLIYVIKQISLNGLTEEQINQVYKEAKILSLIKSNYVVKYYESFLENQDLNIVMEYCDNGDLCNYLNMQKTPLKEDLIWQIFIKITLGLTTIHKMKILHRDLKTLNIFLTKDMGIKIGDLGVAKELNQASFANTLIGTPYYLSPEMCEDKPYNQKSDVWALGCILYELCTYRHPFNASNHGALILKILNTNPDPILAIYSSKLQKLVNQILEKNSQKRPSCIDILNTQVVIEKAKKFGLYGEIINIFSDNNNFITEDINQNIYNNINSIPLDSEDILLKSQYAPNFNDNKIFVKKLDKDQIKVLKANQSNNKRGCLSMDKNNKKINRNQNYYINNNLYLDELNQNQNRVQYANLNNINLLNNIPYNNNYNRNFEYTNINMNTLNNNNLMNGNYFLSTNNFNNLYNNNINQNNNIIYNQILINNTIDNRVLPQFTNSNNEEMKCAKVTRIYNENNQSNINDINNHFEERKIVDISDSLNSLNISVKPAPIDMDRMNDKLENSTNLESKKDNEDNYFRYPLNSDMPMDNFNEKIPTDNNKFLSNIPLQIVSNENIVVHPTLEIKNNFQINKEILKSAPNREKHNNIIDENISLTTDNSSVRQQYLDINNNINTSNKRKKKLNNNKNVYLKPDKNINQRYHTNSMKENSYKKYILKDNLNSNYKNHKKKFTIANLLYKKKTKEQNFENDLLGEIDNNDKLNKTSINLSASDNFNIDIDYQEPIPIEKQIKPFNLNNEIEEDEYSLLKFNKKPDNFILKDIKKDEQEVPNIDDIEKEEEEQENKIRIKEELKSLENKLKKVKNDIKLLVGEEHYKNIIELYSKFKDKDNIYEELEIYIDNNHFNKIKKEKFSDLYLLLLSINSQIKEKQKEQKISKK